MYLSENRTPQARKKKSTFFVYFSNICTFFSRNPIFVPFFVLFEKQIYSYDKVGHSGAASGGPPDDDRAQSGPRRRAPANQGAQEEEEGIAFRGGQGA